MSRFAPKKTSKDVLVDEEYKYGFSDSTNFYSLIESPGLSKKVVEAISAHKNEPRWMRKNRVTAYKVFNETKLPRWVKDLPKINYEKIHYYLKPTESQVDSWDEVPDEIKTTF